MSKHHGYYIVPHMYANRRDRSHHAHDMLWLQRFVCVCVCVNVNVNANIVFRGKDAKCVYMCVCHQTSFSADSISTSGNSAVLFC